MARPSKSEAPAPAKRPERRAASRRARDLERDSLFSLSIDMLCVTGFDGVFKQVNPAFERVLGYPLSEFSSRPFLEFVIEEDQQASLETFRGAVHGGKVITFENRFRHADGSTRWLEWNATPDPEQQVIYATARDITERKRAAADLARFGAIVESSHDAIIGLSLRGVIESWNAAAEEIFGYRAAEVKDKPMSLLIPPGHVDHLGQHLDQIRHGRKVSHYETIRRTKTGEIINVSITLSPVRDITGAIGGASLTARDITARKQAEKERLELLQQLQHALARSKRLTGTLPICTVCKRVCNESGHWMSVEEYIDDYSDAKPILGLCPDHAPPEDERA